MKITAVNGSPKGEQSNSMEIINILKESMEPGTQWQVVSQIREPLSEVSRRTEELLNADVLLIVFPLYVDGIPASLMNFMETLGKGAAEKAGGFLPGRVFAVANCGFHEAVQNETALEIVRHFCRSSGLNWCGGVGIGTGEMIRELRNVPPEAGIRRPLIQTLKALARVIENPEGRFSDNLYTRHSIPWLLFKLSGEWGWRFLARRNGVKPGRIHARPLSV